MVRYRLPEAGRTRYRAAPARAHGETTNGAAAVDGAAVAHHQVLHMYNAYKTHPPRVWVRIRTDYCLILPCCWICLDLPTHHVLLNARFFYFCYFIDIPYLTYHLIHLHILTRSEC
jgi:hypothetical protein